VRGILFGEKVEVCRLCLRGRGIENK